MTFLTPLRDELGRIVSLALPIIGGNMAMMAIGITDTIMVGWHSIEELAALTLATTLFMNIMIFGIGFSTALVPLVASAHATQDARQVRQTTRMALWVSLIYAFAILPVFLFADKVFITLGQDQQIAALAQDYLFIAGPAIIPVLWANVLRSYLSGMEFVKFATLITVLTAAGNVVTNYLLIFGNFGFPEMGVRGAALSSVLLNVIQAIAMSFYAIRRFPDHDLFARFYRPNWDAFFKVFRLGLPISASMLAEVGVFSAATVMMGWIGVIPLAAHGIALQIASVTFMAHLGISQAATIRVGNAFGRGAKDDVLDRAIAAAGLSIMWSLLTIILFLLYAEPLISLFLSSDEPARLDILAVGVVLLAVAAVFQLVDGGQVVAIGLLRGVHDTTVPMVIAIISYWPIGLGASYVFGFVVGLGAVGVWIGLVVGLASAAIALIIRFVLLFKRFPVAAT